MPVTEYWVAMYDKAYAHWADEQGDAKDTAAYVMSFDHIKRLHAKHVEEHGVRAILAAHKKSWTKSTSSQLLQVFRFPLV